MTAESLLDQLPKEEQLALLQGQGVKAGTSSLRAVLDTPTGGAKYLNMESQMDFADNESGFQDQEMNAYVPAPPHLHFHTPTTSLTHPSFLGEMPSI